MTGRILGLTFVNMHRALVGAAWMYCDLLIRNGYAAELIDLTKPGVTEELNRILYPETVEFCFAPQGVGSRLGNGDQTIWAQRRVPFLGLHGDNPCYNIFNHFSNTSYVANLYLYESFADIHRRYIKSDQIVEVLPFQTGDAGPSPIPFRERPIKLLYMKRGESVSECEEKLNSLAEPLHGGVWQQIKRAQASPNLLVCDLVQELFDQINLSREENFDLFWGCSHWMDMYLRRKRAADFVDWLKMQEGAVIIGGGWDFIDRTNIRAVFKESVDISNSLELYWQSRFICNTSPYGSDVLHERAALGLLNGSVVISDTNAWWNSHFSDIPAFKGFDWGRPLDDQLQPVLGMSLAEAEAQAPTGRERALKHFAGADLIGKLFECVGKVKARNAA